MRTVLLYPLVGPWAQSCLRGLTVPGPAPGLPADLAHFSALAAAAAIRARLPFTTRLTAHDGLLALPTLGALRTEPGPTAQVDAELTADRVTFRQGSAAPVTVRITADGTRADDPRWLPVVTLPAVRPGAAPVPLDDLDPYRTAGSGLERHGLSAVTSLDSRRTHHLGPVLGRGGATAPYRRTAPSCRDGGPAALRGPARPAARRRAHR